MSSANPNSTQGRTATRALDLLSEVLHGLVDRLGRTALLLLVFAVGAGAAVSAIGISRTAAQQITDRLTTAALSEVRVHPVRADSTGVIPPLSHAAVERTRTIDAVIAVGRERAVDADDAPVTLLPSSSASEGTFGGATVGVDAAWLAMNDAVVTPSNAQSLLESRPDDRLAIVGYTAGQQLGIADAGPGHRVTIAGQGYEVIGLFRDGSPARQLDDGIYISLSNAQRIASDGEQTLVIRTDPGRAYDVSRIMPVVIDPSDPSAVSVEAVPDLRTLRRGVATDLDQTILATSALLLAFASLATANVMVLSVVTRTPEIALRRALGFSRWNVGALFLLEGFVVGAAGGLLGASLGNIAVVLIAQAQGWSPVIDPWLLPVGVAVGALVGILAAAYPSLRASRVEPALAVRQ